MATGEAPRISKLKVTNYRVLKNVTLSNLTPLTVLLGPNGSGKSTVFDVFAFLSECFTVGVRKAWDRRNRFKELRSRGQVGPIKIELQYSEADAAYPITYHLEIDEVDGAPIVAVEYLAWKRTAKNKPGAPWKFLNFAHGEGVAFAGDLPVQGREREDAKLDTPDLLAVNTLGQLSKHPRVSALRRFITGWYLSYLTADSTRGLPEAGPQEKLSSKGDNLPNVVQYLKERHSQRLSEIFGRLRRRIPQLEKLDALPLADGRLLLQLKDAPFVEPILSKFTSDGTLKMLAYLTVLQDPNPSPLIGIEEPENQLHPKLLEELAEECRDAASHSQLMVTTHSPFFVNALRPSELWELSRDSSGFARAQQASTMKEVMTFVDEGAQLGHLWMEGHFETVGGAARAPRRRRGSR